MSAPSLPLGRWISGRCPCCQYFLLFDGCTVPMAQLIATPNKKALIPVRNQRKILRGKGRASSQG